MYVETIINGKPLQAMLDTGIDIVYMAKELADELGLSYTKEKGFVKGLNATSLLLRVLLEVPSSKSTSAKVRPTLPLPLWMTRSSIWASTFSTW